MSEKNLWEVRCIECKKVHFIFEGDVKSVIPQGCPVKMDVELNEIYMDWGCDCSDKLAEAIKNIKEGTIFKALVRED